MSAPRFIPFDWWPRWLNGYYDTTSTLRKLYFLSLYQPLDYVRYNFNNFGPKYFGTIALDRIGFTTTWHKGYVDTVNPVLNLIRVDTNQPASGLIYKTSLDSMLDEKFFPCWAFGKNGLIYLKNLHLVAFTVTSASGQIDLTSAIAAQTPVIDTGYWLQNSYGDEFYYNPENPNVIGNLILVPADDTYTVTYQSQTVLQQILSGFSYVTVNNLLAILSPYYFRNYWDDAVELDGYNRHLGEDNFSLKKKVQALGFLDDPQSRIAACLGKLDFFAWNGVQSLNVAGSGYTSVISREFIPYNIIDEQPTKDNLRFALTYAPTGFVEVIYRNAIVDPTTYTVSGNHIYFSSSQIQNDSAASLAIRYQTYNFSINSSSNYITSINSPNSFQFPLLMIALKNVLVSTTTDKIPVWNWDAAYEVSNLGLASFN